MWQKSLEKINAENPQVWFSRKKIGKNPLASFMSDLSRECHLSQIYTNHSIRVTGCTVLTRCKFSHSEIMAISGHKSVQSLAIYQKTKQKDKLRMGKALFQSMTRAEDEIDVNQKEIEAREIRALPPLQGLPINDASIQSEKASAPLMAVDNKPNSSDAIVPFEPNFQNDDISDIDLLNAICGVSEEIKTTTSVTNTSNVVHAAPKAMFAKLDQLTSLSTKSEVLPI